MYYGLLTHYTVDGHLDFQVLVIIDNTVLWICKQVFVKIYAFITLWVNT